jgi:hypothetical protein
MSTNEKVENESVVEELDSMYRILGKDTNLWQGDIINREKLIKTEKALEGHQPYIE